MTTIDTPNGTLTAVQVIWDDTHGSANEGWYLRCRYADGHEEEDRVPGLDDADRDESDAHLKSLAFLWVAPPSGFTPDEEHVLNEMIEVRR